MKRKSLFASVVVCSIFLTACSSSDPEIPQNDPPQTRIEGRVYDALNGQPIPLATISTDPPTTVVSTSQDGTFTISDSINGAGQYQVMVKHFAYETAQSTVSVANNTATKVDFGLTSSAIGLHASTNTVQFKPAITRETFRLSSNIQQTGFSILVSDPWFTVSPTQGVIANLESVLVELKLDRKKIPVGESGDSELIINADNGTRELVINIDINPDATDSPLHSRQHDCRQNAVLQFGYDDPNYPLIQFAKSLELPVGAGARNIKVGSPFLIDSFILRELGVVTITHTDGGPDNTSLELFELDLEDKIASIAVNTGVSEDNQRARIQWALIPGVYCYYLGGTDENFVPPQYIDLTFEYTPPQ